MSILDVRLHPRSSAASVRCVAEEWCVFNRLNANFCYKRVQLFDLWLQHVTGFSEWERFHNIEIEVRTRQSGVTVGTVDPYYWVPLENGLKRKCRSCPEVYQLLLPQGTPYTRVTNRKVASSHRNKASRANQNKARCKNWTYDSSL